MVTDLVDEYGDDLVIGEPAGRVSGEQVAANGNVLACVVSWALRVAWGPCRFAARINRMRTTDYLVEAQTS